MGHEGDAPGDGIGHIQAVQCTQLAENGEDPQHPHAAGAHQTDDGGGPRAAQAAHTAAGHFHQTGDEIAPAHIGHSHKAHVDDGLPHALFVGGVDAQQSMV